MGKQPVVNNKNDILQNIRTFEGYRSGSDDEKKFHNRGLKNSEYFIVTKNGDRYTTFTPAGFVGYKNNNRCTYNPNAPKQHNKISVLLEHQCCRNGDGIYDDVNAGFDEYVKKFNIDRNTKDIRYYWLISEPKISEVEQEGECDGKLARRVYGGPPESKEHLLLKRYVKMHPQKFGAPENCDAIEEKLLKSRDEIDVWCMVPGEQLAIEVKSVRSNDSDIERGIFQCVKYRAVLEAEAKCDDNSPKVRTRLVSERPLSAECCRQAKRLGIEVQVIKPLGLGIV
jgi:hypothetical protein